MVTLYNPTSIGIIGANMNIMNMILDNKGLDSPYKDRTIVSDYFCKGASSVEVVLKNKCH